jgi:endonuclease YncB( thermonuclease family)
MRIFKAIPLHQKIMMPLVFLGVAAGSLSANREVLGAAGRVVYEDPKPFVIDGDTVSVRGQHIRIIGFDAPDDPSVDLKALAKAHLAGLVERDGGIVCSLDLVDVSLPRKGLCLSPARSFGRLNLSCEFPRNKASVAATMVAHGYGVDYRRYSGGAYSDMMARAAASGRGLWGQDYEAMMLLAEQRAILPPKCR